MFQLLGQKFVELKNYDTIKMSEVDLDKIL
jgi:hypothetical protein